MRQARTILPTYSADTFGVCSALFELGGLTIMHDASGCNSTYSTHDEPRWYDSKGLVFISGLTEIDAITGNDNKVIEDAVKGIKKLKPSFASIVGTPIPMLTGFDYCAAAKTIEKETEIPCFGFDMNGMRSYIYGVSEALHRLAINMTNTSSRSIKGGINIIGATPLDFGLSNTIDSIKEILTKNNFSVIGTWAIGTTLDDIARASEAEVNLVVSSSGIKAAQTLKKLYDTPYVVGLPIGDELTRKITNCLRMSIEDGIDRIAFADVIPEKESEIMILGESVISRSIASYIYSVTGIAPLTLNTIEELTEFKGIMSETDEFVDDEEGIIKKTENRRIVIADPLFKTILSRDTELISLPHLAFSGRIYEKYIPDLISIRWQEQIKEQVKEIMK